ncbi:MAG: lysostaphin resistance A-like protein [Candidatus Micrarchaeaceae archaeon]
MLVKLSKKRRATQQKGPEKAAIRYVSYIITSVLVVLMFLFSLYYANGTMSQPMSLADSSIALSLFFPSIVFSYLFFRGRTFASIIEEFGLTKKSLTLKMLGVGVLLYISVFVAELVVGLFSAITNIPLPTNVNVLFAGVPLYFLIFTVLIAPIDEEIFFRGFLISRISSLLGSRNSKSSKNGAVTSTMWFGIVISAAIFAVLHIEYLSVSEFVLPLFFGIVAGYVFMRYKSIYPTILAHAIVNLLGVLSLIYIGMLIHL